MRESLFKRLFNRKKPDVKPVIGSNKVNDKVNDKKTDRADKGAFSSGTPVLSASAASSQKKDNIFINFLMGRPLYSNKAQVGDHAAAVQVSAPATMPKSKISDDMKKGLDLKNEAPAINKPSGSKPGGSYAGNNLGHGSAEPNVSEKDLDQKRIRSSKKIDELLRQRAKAKSTKKLTKNSLQEYLDKAGYDISAEKVKKNVFKGIIIAFLLITVLVLLINWRPGADMYRVAFFMIGLWTAVFIGVLLFAMACVYFFLDYRIYSRTKEIEEVFPDFLQLASSNISAGMPIDKALWYAIRPNFGVLAKEMEEVAKATMTGEDLEVSLLRFANKYDSQIIRRSVNILIEGMRAGGEISELLDKIALNIQDMKIMKKEMAANVTTYAIFITFAAVIIAPFLFALATELLTIIIKITTSLGSSATTGTFSFSAPDPNTVDSFRIFSIVTLVITAVFSTAIVSVIKYGRVMEGIKNMPIAALVSIGLYYASSSILHSVFSSII